MRATNHPTPDAAPAVVLAPRPGLRSRLDFGGDACVASASWVEAIDLEAIGRRLCFLKDNNGNIIELAAPLR